jgi:tryptophan-specific transport protein
MMNATAAPLPGLLLGTAIVFGTAVGAGMLSLPVAAAGLGFSWAAVVMTLTWCMMMLSGLMLVEANLHFPLGSGFDTIVSETLGRRWNQANGASLVFVLFTLSYAYISAGGSVLEHLSGAVGGAALPGWTFRILFGLLIALAVWLGTAVLGTLSALLIVGMAASFALCAYQLTPAVDKTLLVDLSPRYLAYSVAAVPPFLTAFAYHACVPSLVRFLHPNPGLTGLCVVVGTIASLLIYVTWLLLIFGIVPRGDFSSIIADGGNMKELLSAVEARSTTFSLQGPLGWFANFALVSSFLGVSLGLFDFVSDRLSRGNGAKDRAITVALTLAAPLLCSALFPDGFVFAIGLAGVTALLWGTLVPALCVQRLRQGGRLVAYRAPGGRPAIALVKLYGCVLAVCFVLDLFELAPSL